MKIQKGWVVVEIPRNNAVVPVRERNPPYKYDGVSGYGELFYRKKDFIYLILLLLASTDLFKSLILNVKVLFNKPKIRNINNEI